MHYNYGEVRLNKEDRVTFREMCKDLDVTNPQTFIEFMCKAYRTRKAYEASTGGITDKVLRMNLKK